MPLVRFEDLSVRLGARLVLEHISAEAPDGGATVLVGPNGAGKTTLLHCLLGEEAYSGKIVIEGARGARPRMAYVPQQLQVDRNLPLKVSEFLALGLQRRPLWLGLAKATCLKAQKLLELVHCEHLGESRLGALSGGELRRILLASALGHEPELLILDEAEAGVDYHGEHLFWELLDATRKKLGFTMIMVSHNLPLAAHYATHILCLKKTLLAQGSPRATLTAKNLLALFGMPIHLYSEQCDSPGPECPECGALGAGIYTNQPDPKAQDLPSGAAPAAPKNPQAGKSRNVA